MTEPVEARRPPSRPAVDARQRNVLLVEEDEVVRKMVAGILTADGYRMTAVKSLPRPCGQAAAPVQLLIADLAGEGEKFARQLFGTGRAPRVLCTSNHDFKMPVDWLPPGRQVGLTKLYALSELVRTVRETARCLKGRHVTELYLRFATRMRWTRRKFRAALSERAGNRCARS